MLFLKLVLTISLTISLKISLKLPLKVGANNFKMLNQNQINFLIEPTLHIDNILRIQSHRGIKCVNITSLRNLMNNLKNQVPLGVDKEKHKHDMAIVCIVCIKFLSLTIKGCVRVSVTSPASAVILI